MILNSNLISTVLALNRIVKNRTIEPIPVRNRSSKISSLAVWSVELYCSISLLLVERWAYCYGSLTIVEYCKVELRYVASASIVVARDRELEIRLVVPPV